MNRSVKASSPLGRVCLALVGLAAVAALAPAVAIAAPAPSFALRQVGRTSRKGYFVFRSRPGAVIRDQVVG